MYSAVAARSEVGPAAPLPAAAGASAGRLIDEIGEAALDIMIKDNRSLPAPWTALPATIRWQVGECCSI
jgi:hypothetical protein